MTLTLIRMMSKDWTKEWLVVQDGEREVLRLDWNDDLITWWNAHSKEIEETGDINPFLEYYHNWRQRQRKK